jgi:hypothetical protein
MSCYVGDDMLCSCVVLLLPCTESETYHMSCCSCVLSCSDNTMFSNVYCELLSCFVFCHACFVLVLLDWTAVMQVVDVNFIVSLRQMSILHIVSDMLYFIGLQQTRLVLLFCKLFCKLIWLTKNVWWSDLMCEMCDVQEIRFVLYYFSQFLWCLISVLFNSCAITMFSLSILICYSLLDWYATVSYCHML